mgnify:CR=1 FL=1
MNNGAIIDAIETISNQCETMTDCDNCILKKLCTTVLSDKVKSIPYYWMDLLSRKDNDI